MSERKPVPGSLLRLDSGVFSAEPTPVTPSQPELHVPAPNPPPQLPPIRESAGSLDEGALTRSLEAVAMDREAANASASQPENGSCCAPPLRRSSLGQIPEFSRPSRPTSLAPAFDGDPDSFRQFVPRSPEVPQPTIALTPLLASLNLDDISHFSPEQFSSIQQKAQEIVRREVPQAVGTESAATGSVCPGAGLPRPDVAVPDVPSEQIYPKQRLLFPLNLQNMVQCGRDGKYYENRDYDRTDTDLLGEGGFGMVYACRDKVLKTLFAIKKNNKEDSIASMQQECQMMSTIGAHANITMFIGALEDDYSNISQMSRREWKMLLELADNGNLSEMLIDPDTHEPVGLAVDQSLYYLQQILYAVYYLHQRQFLHLDLKCKNILVFNDGRRVKLTDFGSALRIGLEDGMFQSLMAYTPNFTAPEVVRGEHPSFSADVWSVMCVLVEMLTGKLPWCYTEELERVKLIMRVGRYENEMIDQLVPFGNLELDDAVVSLFRSVLITDCSRRPTALDLLRLSIIRDAHEYEKFFDECQYGYEEEELPLVPISEVMAMDTLTADGLEEQSLQMPLLGDRHSDATMEIASAVSTEMLGRRSSTSCPSTIEHQRVSVDSGSYSMSGRASTSSSSGASSCVMSPEGSNGKFLQSQPARTNSCPAISQTTHVPSLVSAQLQDSDVEEQGETIGNPRRQPDDDTETDSGKTVRRNLKRTSSEHYVSNGPDVDSPDARRAQQCFSAGCGAVIVKGPGLVGQPADSPPQVKTEGPADGDSAPRNPCKGGEQSLLVARGLIVSQDKGKAMTMKTVL